MLFSVLPFSLSIFTALAQKVFNVKPSLAPLFPQQPLLLPSVPLSQRFSPYSEMVFYPLFSLKTDKEMLGAGWLRWSVILTT
jgi:hypothetical protein